MDRLRNAIRRLDDRMIGRISVLDCIWGPVFVVVMVWWMSHPVKIRGNGGEWVPQRSDFVTVPDSVWNKFKAEEGLK